MKKILVIRFSSIGDVVLTSPVVRALKLQLGAEVHFVTRSPFRPLVEHNPHVSRVFHFDASIAEVLPDLKKEKYDLVVDLHKNLRSLRLKRSLKVRTLVFDKINLRKFLAVRFKLRSMLPDKHIVDRYFEALSAIGVTNDGLGLEHFISDGDVVDTAALFFRNTSRRFIVLVIGGSYHTKRIPFNKLVQICDRSQVPVVLLGGKEDKAVADQLRNMFPHLINGSGQFSINQSASIISQADWVITSDTGLMHMAAAYHKRIISVWGNTIPRFGMAPYQPHPENVLLEVNTLSCRPCSKLGYMRCPRGHFRCMQDIDYEFVKELK